MALWLDILRGKKGIERRRPDGRALPYRALRTLAKLYTVAAPLVLGVMVLIGIIAFNEDAPTPVKVGMALGLGLLGLLYYLMMTAVAQAIYLMFDVARGVNQLTSAAETAKSQPPPESKLL
jgi:hypothetical protein